MNHSSDILISVPNDSTGSFALGGGNPPTAISSSAPSALSAFAGINNNIQVVSTDFSQRIASTAENGSITTISADIHTMCNTLVSMCGNLSDMNQNICVLGSDMKELHRSTQQNTQNIEKLDSRMTAVESEVSTLRSTTVNQSINVHEVAERVRRSSNIILYNVAENSDGNGVDLVNIFSRLKDVDLTGVTTTRLGRPSSSSTVRRSSPHRPLLVTMKSNLAALNILKQRSLLPREISVTNDRTQQERSAIKAVRDSVAQHNLANPHNLMRLKFVNNEPTMVPLTQLSQAMETDRQDPHPEN